MKLSLRNKFLMPTLIIIILGMATSSFIGYTYSKQALQKTLTHQIKQVVNSLDLIVKSWVNDRRMDAETWARQGVFISALENKDARQGANQEMAQLKKTYPYYEDIVLVDSNGDIKSASNPKIIGKVNLKDREYFKEAMKGKLFVSEVIKSRVTGKGIFSIATPVKANGVQKGIFCCIVDVSNFGVLFVDSVKVGEKGYAAIFQGNGQVIAHPDKKNILEMNMNDYEFGREMLQRGSGMITYSLGGVEKETAFKKVDGLGWTIAAVVPTEELLAPAKRIGYITLLVALGVVFLAGVVVFLIAQSIVKPVTRISGGLSDGATQVASASGQVASSSQTLAEGSSEQAASLEETSSSLEEMASMTKQNADNAAQADGLMKETNGVVKKANESMVELTTSMADISHASEETSKIIKTIDEIAFQTNLLALNAAVEAARAGEAGAGFAVVADEVRNLAMRAADAAKNTASLIETTVKKVNDGSELVQKTSEAFKEVEERSVKVGSLVEEIATASHEQSEGIDQVNRAVGEMDRVVQQNAASAEESSSASQEMSAQAESMHGLVRELVSLVTGGNGASPKSRKAGKGKSASAPAPFHRKEMIQSKQAKAITSGKQGGKEVNPEQVIPLENDDFSDF